MIHMFLPSFVEISKADQNYAEKKDCILPFLWGHGAIPPKILWVHSSHPHRSAKFHLNPSSFWEDICKKCHLE